MVASGNPENWSNLLSSNKKSEQDKQTENLLAVRFIDAEESVDEKASPKISKSKSFKRIKFPPEMLIKQSQDDGGDEVTWRTSPVNERLPKVSKRKPKMLRVLADTSRLKSLSTSQCSQKKVHFEILSLSGSYVRTDLGEESGGLSVYLSIYYKLANHWGWSWWTTKGLQDLFSKRDVNTGVKVEASAPRMPSAVDCSGRNMVRGNDVQQQAIGGSHFMIQGMHGFTDWRGGPDARSTGAGAYELTGMIYSEGLK